MTLRGDIVNSGIADRAREYAYSVVSRYAPRGISPTDIDGAVETNGHFLFWEFKTEGAIMKYGQKLFWHRMLMGLAPKAVLLYAQHPRLDTVNVPADITRFEIWRVHDGKIKQHGPFFDTAALQQVNNAFYRWAEHDPNALAVLIQQLELPF
jgi:hypothetical protein